MWKIYLHIHIWVSYIYIYIYISFCFCIFSSIPFMVIFRSHGSAVGIYYWLLFRGEHRPPPIWQCAGLVIAKPTRWSLRSKCFPAFSENWHVCFGDIVRPGIILLLFGIDLLPRGCHFLVFVRSPGPLENIAGKNTNPEKKKHYLLVFLSWFVRYASVSILCCFRDVFLVCKISLLVWAFGCRGGCHFCYTWGICAFCS